MQFEQCLSIQSNNQKKNKSPLKVKFVTQSSFQTMKKQDDEHHQQQRLIMDFSKQNLTQLKEFIFWDRLLHLILDENKLSDFDTNFLKRCPQIQIISLSSNLLKKFGPLSMELTPKLCILNISQNLIEEVDTTLFELKLKKLFIQQNCFVNLNKRIGLLSLTLESLGLGWGIFCQQQFDYILEDQQLKYFFMCLEAMPQNITFEYYLNNYKQIKDVVENILTQSIDNMNESTNSLNEQQIIQIKDTLGSYNFSQNDDNTFFSYNNDYKQNLMHLAVLNNEIGILNYLLNNYLQLINQVDLKGHTPLSLAIEKKLYRLVQIMLTKKVNTNIGGGLQSSNLHIVAQQCQVELLLDLLDQGADPSTQDIFKDTPLHIVSQNNDHKRVKQFYSCILQQQFNINTFNIKGQSCLEILVEKNNFITLQFCNEWNLEQIRKGNIYNIFNFDNVNPHTKYSLLDKAILTKNRNIQLFFLNFKLVTITYQTLMICFNSNIKNVLLYKLMKRELLNNRPIIYTSEKQIPNNSPINSARDKIQVDIIQSNNSSFEDDQLSNESDNGPCQISQNLKQLNSWTPKFQMVHGASKLKRSFYDIISNLSESVPPEDEFSIRNLLNKGNISQIITKKNMDQRFKQNLRQHNYSPNNIRMIDSRNAIFKYDSYHQKRQLAIYQKKMRSIVSTMQTHLRLSNEFNQEIVFNYCKCQLLILDQFTISKVGKELIKLDQQIDNEIKQIRSIIQKQSFPKQIQDELLNQFEVLCNYSQ